MDKLIGTDQNKKKGKTQITNIRNEMASLLILKGLMRAYCEQFHNNGVSNLDEIYCFENHELRSLKKKQNLNSPTFSKQSSK